MVELNTRGQTCVLILKPNTSMSWHGNKVLLGALAATTFAVALFWTQRGAWVILPFAGIEIVILASCLYLVCWKLSFQQVVHISPDQLLIEEGHHAPIRQYYLDRHQAAIAVERAQQPWETTKTSLFDRREEIPLGQFLNNDEHETLLKSLQLAGLRVGRDTPSRQQPF